MLVAYNVKEDYGSLFECSSCGWSDDDTTTGDTGVYNYCPNCGLKIVKKKDIYGPDVHMYTLEELKALPDKTWVIIQNKKGLFTAIINRNAEEMMKEPNIFCFEAPISSFVGYHWCGYDNYGKSFVAWAKYPKEEQIYNVNWEE